MNQLTHLLAVLVGVLSLIVSGHGLTCYKCRATNPMDCIDEDKSNWPTQECNSHQTQCLTYEYNVFSKRNPDVEPVFIGTGLQRRCGSPSIVTDLKEDDYCSFLSNTQNSILEAGTNTVTTTIKRCILCDGDNCNTV